MNEENDGIVEEQAMKEEMDRDGEEDGLVDKNSDTNLVSSTPSSYTNISYNAALVKTIYLRPKTPPLSTCQRIWVKCCCGCLF